MQANARKSWTLIAALAAAAGLLLYAQHWWHPAGTAAGSEWPIGYSADFTISNAADRAKNCTGRIYANTIAGPRALRYETACGNRTRIELWKQGGAAVVIDPVDHVYWEPPTRARLSAVKPPQGTRETLYGRVVEHYTAPVPQPDGSKRMYEVWQDVRLHATLRSVTGDRVFELRNIREGAQPASLFAVPKGYRKIPPPAEQETDQSLR